MSRPLSVVLAATTLAGLAFAQPSTPGAFNPPANGPRRADSTWVALRDCTVHVDAGRVMEHATVVFRDGVITAVMPAEEEEPMGGGGEGRNSAGTAEVPGEDSAGTAEVPGKPRAARVPIGPRVMDGKGLHVYAAFIDPYVEVTVPGPPADQPGKHWNEGVTPQRTSLDGGAGIDAGAAEALRKIGFGAAAISPTGGIFRGSAAVVSLAKAADDRSVSRPPVYRAGVYQSVGLSAGGFRGYPGSQMGAIALIRQTLIDAEWQARAKEGGQVTTESALDALSPGGSDDPWLATELGGDRRGTPILFDAGDELEALRAGKIAREFHRRWMVLGSGTEFRRLDAVAADGAGAYLLPVNFPKAPDVSTPSKQEAVELRDLMTWEQAPTNPRRLAGAGVAFAFTTARLRDKGQFLENVRKAIKHGLGEEAALAALTTTPAELLGLANELGTVEAGKRANLIVCDGPIFAEKTKLRGVWVDGRPHELFDPGTKLEGEWSLEVQGAPEAERWLAIAKDNAVTIHRGDKSVKATKVAVDGDRVAFAYDAKALGAGEGVWVASAAIERDAAGLPARLTGQAVMNDGQVFAWSASKRPPSIAGMWHVVFDDPEHHSPVLLIGKDGQVRMAAGFKAPGAEMTDESWDGHTLRYTFDMGEAGGGGEARVEMTADFGSDPVTLRGAVNAGEGKRFAFKAVRFEPAGRWTPAKEDAAEPPVVLVEKDAVTVIAGEKKVKASAVRIEENRITYTYDRAGLAGEGQTTEELFITGDTLTGVSTLPDGTTKEWTAAREKKDKKDGPEEDEAIKAIPETYGMPFGPYALEEVPQQGFVILENATVWTQGPGGKIDKGVVVMGGGKVLGVFEAGSDYGVAMPPDGGKPTVIDCTGKHITPGIIDCHSHTGISRGVNEGGQAVTSEVRIEDVTNPDTTNWYWQLAGGVTCVNNLHGSANAIGGQSQTNKIRWGCAHPDDMHVEGAAPGIKFALGENPRQVNGGGSDRYPQTRMGVETLIRDRFTAAREYTRARETARRQEFEREAREVSEGGGGLPSVGALFREPVGVRRDLELEALAEVLAGERLVHCHAYRQDEIVMLCQVAKEFGFRIGTFQHILEGYKVADWVRDYSGGGSGFSDWWAYKMEVQDAIPGGLPLMAEVGCTISFNSDSDEMARRMNVEAGKAVKYGRQTEEEALAFVTINPAKQLGIDQQTGSIEVGKDADIAVWSGPPLSSLSRCERTFVDGRELFSLEQDAGHRTKIAAERSRLIQKLLADGKKGKAEGEEKKDDATTPGDGAGPRRRGPRPPQLAGYTDAEIEALQAYYLDVMERGRPANEAGACGCGLGHE